MAYRRFGAAAACESECAGGAALARAAAAASPADLVGLLLPAGQPFTLHARDACLYALGVGAGRQPVFAGGAELRCGAAQTSCTASRSPLPLSRAARTRRTQLCV